MKRPSRDSVSGTCCIWLPFCTSSLAVSNPAAAEFWTSTSFMLTSPAGFTAFLKYAWRRSSSCLISLADGGPVGVAVGVAVGGVDWVTSQKGNPLDLSSAANPTAVLAGDRRTTTALAAVSGILFGAIVGAMAGAAYGVMAGAVAGTGIGVAAGIIGSFDRTAWPSYEIARIWLVLRHRLPWPLMDFLADAHRRGVLRRAGAVYQFRHIELQHRLATRP
jgi:hypothetical protein